MPWAWKAVQPSPAPSPICTGWQKHVMSRAGLPAEGEHMQKCLSASQELLVLLTEKCRMKVPQGRDGGVQLYPLIQELQIVYFPLTDNTLANLFLLFVDVHGRPKDSLLLSTENGIQFPKNIRNTGYEEFVFPRQCTFSLLPWIKIKLLA